MKKINGFLLILFFITISKTNAQFVNIIDPVCTDSNQVINAIGSPQVKYGILHSGIFGLNSAANNQFISNGFNNFGLFPRGDNQYGYSSNWNTDKFFCGLRLRGNQNATSCNPISNGTVFDETEALISWGDNDGTGGFGGADQLTFEFSRFDNNQERIASMFPNGTIGIGNENRMMTDVGGTYPFINTTHLHVFGRGVQTTLTEAVNGAGNSSAGYDARLANLLGQDQLCNFTMRKYGSSTGVVPSNIGLISTQLLNALYATGGGTRGSGSMLLGVSSNSPIHFLNNATERMRIAAGGFVGIGGNYITSQQPKRRLDVFDNTNAQLRLSFNQGTTATSTGVGSGIYTDFRTINTGDLVIRPFDNANSRNVGIGNPSFSPNPSQRIDIDGNARLRSVPTGNIDFIMTATQTPLAIRSGGTNDIILGKLPVTGSASDVLHGDGTWGPITSASVSANNGCTTNGSFVQLGQKCGDSGAKLQEDREIPFNNHNLVLTDGDLTEKYTNRVGIGTICTPNAKLEVVRHEEPLTPGESYGYEFENRAIAGINFDIASVDGNGIGVYGEANHPTNANNIGGDFKGMKAQASAIGVRGIAESSQKNLGVRGETEGLGGILNIAGSFSSKHANNTNIGVDAEARAGKTAIGGRFIASSATTDGGISWENNVGVLAETDASGLGGGTSTSNNWAGYFNGDVYTSSSTYYSSDARLKNNVKDLNNGMEIISKLNPKRYEYNNNKNLILPQGEHLGLIAQEVKEVLPNITKEFKVFDKETKKFTDEKYLSVNYIELIPILIQGMKEQQAEIEKLKTQLSNQSNEKANYPANQTSSIKEVINQIDVLLSDNQMVVLSQNVPNPFSESTTIGYYIPENTRKAEISFSTLNGKKLKTIQIEDKGKGIINVYGNDLSNGIYVYSLIIDGKIIESKKMTVVNN